MKNAHPGHVVTQDRISVIIRKQNPKNQLRPNHPRVVEAGYYY